MNRTVVFTAAVTIAALGSGQHADAGTATDWNGYADTALIQGGIGNAILQSRALSTAQVAVYDAVNSITREFVPYAVNENAAPGTNADAAAAAAAHKVLVAFIPSQQAYLDSKYAQTLAGIPDGPGKDAGIALGESVADQIMALRSTDGFTSGGTYTPKQGPGYWRPHAPAFGPAIFPLLGTVRPWALSSGDQFRSGPPFWVGTPEFAADYAEVKAVGAANSTVRTQNQTDAAHFWYEGAPLTWNRIARPLAVERNLSLSAEARLYAALAVGYMDGFIAGFDTKYAVEFWRPITAIRETEDPTWTPLRPTPPHPDFVSTHSVLGGAAAEILGETFGKQTAFTTTGSTTGPGLIRSYRSFKEAATDNTNSRIWVGVHFREACEVGQAMGKKVGGHIHSNFFQRAP